MVNVIIFDAHICMNHLMEQNILQIGVCVTFIQGLRKKYNTATATRIIIAVTYITARRRVNMRSSKTVILVMP